MSEEQPWVAVKDVCSSYGVNYATAKNKIAAGTFPVKTYKVGKMFVIAREVHAEFFRLKSEAGLRALKSTKS